MHNVPQYVFHNFHHTVLLSSICKPLCLEYVVSFTSFYTGSQFYTPERLPHYQITNFHLQPSHTVCLHSSGENFRQVPWHLLPGPPKSEESPLLGMHASTLTPMARISTLNKQKRDYTDLFSPFPQTDRMTISVLSLSTLFISLGCRNGSCIRVESIQH